MYRGFKRRILLPTYLPTWVLEDFQQSLRLDYARKSNLSNVLILLALGCKKEKKISTLYQSASGKSLAQQNSTR